MDNNRAPASDAAVDPPSRAWPMALIGFLQFNIGVGAIWGSFSVLLVAVETRLGISRTASTMAVPLVTFTSALLLPILGSYLTRGSLRSIALTGAALTVAGFILLATVPTYTAYLLAFGLLLGPGQAVAVIAPATLVTRWFRSGQGKAMGFVCSPIVIALIPFLTSATLQRFGLSATYAMLALLSGVSLVANLFIRDYPSSRPDRALADATRVDGGRPALAMKNIARLPVFWCLFGVFVPQMVGAIILSAHMVPLAQSWGLSARAAVTLLSIQSLAGIAGTLGFGMLADRLGGTRTIALMAFVSACLWSCFLISPSFTSAIFIIGLIGMCAAGVTPVINHSLSEVLGNENFSRAYGLINILVLPFSVAAAPAGAMIFTYAGAYTAVIVAQVGWLTLAVLFGLLAIRLCWIRREGSQTDVTGAGAAC